MLFALKKRIMKLRSKLISNRNERRLYFDSHIEKLVDDEVKANKWGVSYSVFDGEELLEASIKALRDEVDYVNVVYQTKSWYGNPASPDLLPFLQRLKADGLVDELIEYEAEVGRHAGKQETTKRNMGLKAAKKAGVNYFMTIDCDEFYIRQELHNAKRYIVRHQITHAFVPSVNYGFQPTHRMVKASLSDYAEIFSKIGWFSKLCSNPRVTALVDPTRQLSHRLFRSKYFVVPYIARHHMSRLRKDLKKKMDNSSFEGFFDKNPIRMEMPESEYVICENIFNIDTSEW